MKINGKERKMMLTVGATEKIAPLCPNGDFKRIFDIATDRKYNDIVDDDIKIAVILINAYENNAALESGTASDLIAFEDFNKDAITPGWIRRLETEITEAIMVGLETEIETEEVKKNEGSEETK